MANFFEREVIPESAIERDYNRGTPFPITRSTIIFSKKLVSEDSKRFPYFLCFELKHIFSDILQMKDLIAA